MNDIERRQQLRRLWMDTYPEGKRTATQVLIFHGWLEKNWPELLDRTSGETFRELKSDLMDLWQTD